MPPESEQQIATLVQIDSDDGGDGTGVIRHEFESGYFRSQAVHFLGEHWGEAVLDEAGG